MPPDTPNPDTGDTALLAMLGGTDMPPEKLAALLEGDYDVKPELEMLLQVAAAHPEIQGMLRAAGGRR